MRRRSLLLAAFLAALAACRLPADLDGLPENAIPVAIGRAYVDLLDCRRNDCVDWFSVRMPAKGDLEIQVRSADTSPEAMSAGLTLLDPAGKQLAQASAQSTASGAELRLQSPVANGVYLFALAAPGTRKRIDYRLLVTFRAAPEPPVTRIPKGNVFRTVSTRILEVEGRRSVLLEAGARAGLRPGQSGKLFDGDRKIGDITVIEVFNDGSRARIDGGLSGSITPKTRADIQVSP